MPADRNKRDPRPTSENAGYESHTGRDIRDPGAPTERDGYETHIEGRIAGIAASQRGCVRTADLVGAGLTRRQIDHRARSGALHRLFQGVYLVGHPVPPPLALETAALLVTGPGSALSHQTAAWLHGIAERPQEVHVTTTQGRHRSRPGLVLHRSSTLRARATWHRGGLRVTDPTQTILDLAAAVPVQQLEPVLNEALVLRKTSRPALLEAVRRRAGRPGTAALRAILDAAPLETLSEAERILLRLVRDAGLPDPEVNRWRAIGRVDLRWPGHVVEVDGYDAHTTPRAFERDRRRDRAARAAGHAVDRFAASEVIREPVRVLAEVVRALAETSARAG